MTFGLLHSTSPSVVGRAPEDMDSFFAASNHQIPIIMITKFKASCHGVRQIREEYFVASWEKSFITKKGLMSSRLMSRDMDRAGAERFARKWGCNIKLNPRLKREHTQ